MSVLYTTFTLHDYLYMFMLLKAKHLGRLNYIYIFLISSLNTKQNAEYETTNNIMKQKTEYHLFKQDNYQK